MDTRYLYENQIELLTNQCRILMDQIDQMDSRMAYFESVIVTLLTALKEGGIIVDTDEPHDGKTYEC